MSTSTLTSKGQVTIPRDVRRRLNLERGDVLSFRFDERGQLIVSRSSGGIAALAGCLSRYARRRPVTITEMKAAVRAHVARDFQRSVGD